jgi:hypothetical protein
VRGAASSTLRTPRPAGTGLVARWALHVALMAALGAFVAARDDRSILVLLIPLALAPVLRWRRVPGALLTLLPAVLRVSLVATLALAVLSRQLRFIQEDLGFRYGGILGWTLAILAVLFILGHRLWPVATTLLPAIVGLLVVSGLKPGVSLFLYFAAASAFALWTFAFVHGGPRRLGAPLAAFLAAAALVSVATVHFLPWAQPHVEQAVARTFAEGTTGLSGESRLGEFGKLAVSDRIVLRVWTSHPQLLRAYVFTRFDGREWSAGERQETRGAKPLLPIPGDLPATALPGVAGNVFVIPPGERPLSGSRGLLETQVLQSVVTDWPLLVPASPRLVRAPTPYLSCSREGVLRWPPYAPARRYGIVHDDPEHIARAEGSSSARAASLGLPARLDPRVRVLAAVLATDAASDRARLANTVAWLQRNFTYSLDVGEFETADPLAEFLFEKKQGYCEYFASAAAVLLRLQGIPARYVKGFGVGPHNFVAGRLGVSDHYLVRDSDAHAWVEAYIRGEGWVEADPTPADGFAVVHERTLGWLDSLVEALRVHGAELWARLVHEGFAGLLGALTATAEALLRALSRRPWATGVLVVAVVLALTWRGLRALVVRLRLRRRSRLERQAALPSELGALLASVEGHWARHGRPRPPSRGLREHLDSLSSDVLSPPAREASAEVVAACYRSAYGGEVPGSGEIERLRGEVARLD